MKVRLRCLSNQQSNAAILASGYFYVQIRTTYPEITQPGEILHTAFPRFHAALIRRPRSRTLGFPHPSSEAEMIAFYSHTLSPTPPIDPDWPDLSSLAHADPYKPGEATVLLLRLFSFNLPPNSSLKFQLQNYRIFLR